MPIGATIRRCFGPLEPQISSLYRNMFVNLNEWTSSVQNMKPDAKRILEVGCGEGASTEFLFHTFPDATIDAIDISDRLVRMFRPSTDNVRFSKEYVEERAITHPGEYDLIILSDVLHHVPEGDQISLLKSIGDLLASDGVFAFKDWARSNAPIYFAALFADRYLTGDDVKYKTPTEARNMLASVFGESSISPVLHVSPWRSNYAYKISKYG